jgi:DNA invertase Pin-like site-specific DNA recombinase
MERRSLIARECKRWGWQEINGLDGHGYSRADLRRPAIKAAIEALGDGNGDCLVVAKQASEVSLAELAALIGRAQKSSWGLVAIDCGPNGGKNTNGTRILLATFAQFDRRLIAQRTREALAQKRREGVILGRPRSLPSAVVRRIQRSRGAGDSFPRIAESLNADNVPTAQGGVRWYPATVRAVYISRARD